MLAAVHVARLDLPVSRLAELRRRTVGSLVAGVALGSTGHIAAVTVATIVAERPVRLGPAQRRARARPSSSARRSARRLLSRLMVVRGRRIGLATGYGIGVARRRHRDDRGHHAARSRSCSSGRC